MPITLNEPPNENLAQLLQTLHEEPNSAKVMIKAFLKKKWKGNEKFPRSSKYRGVSKNGTKWQVIKSYLIDHF